MNRAPAKVIRTYAKGSFRLPFDMLRGAGSKVLYVYCMFFFRPAGRKKNIPKAKIRVLA
jgi:hypothetical protein